MFRTSLVIAGLAAIASGCADSTSTFGRSYDECILKNAGVEGDRMTRDRMIQACARRFERTADDSEQTPLLRDFEIGDPPLFGNTRGIPDEKIMRFKVRNQLPKSIVTEVAVTVRYYDKPVDEAGQQPADAKLLWTFNETYPVFLEPGDFEDLSGEFPTGRPPSGNAFAEARASKIVPLG